MTVNAYLDRWLEASARPRLSERTMVDYTHLLERYVRPRLGSAGLTKLTPLAIQELYSYLHADRKLGRSCRMVHNVLRSALKQAVRWRLMVHNPCDDVNPPKERRRAQTIKAMTLLQAQSFLEAARDHRHAPIFRLALGSGMRPEEYLGLRWPQVDWQAGAVWVDQVLVRITHKKGWQLEDPKTPGSRRTIPLPEELMKDLRQVHIRQQQERLIQGDGWNPHGFVFVGDFGEPLHRNNLNGRDMKEILRAAGLPLTFSLYTLRHSCATLLLARGVNSKVVAERLGNSVKLMLDVYTSVLPTMQQQAVDILGADLFPPPPSNGDHFGDHALELESVETPS